MNQSNYVGAVSWYIVTAAEQVAIPDFVFERASAPYLIGQAHSGAIYVFDRVAMLELITMWQVADSEMRQSS